MMRLNKTFLAAAIAAGLSIAATGIAQTAKSTGDAKAAGAGGAPASTGATPGAAAGTGPASATKPATPTTTPPAGPGSPAPGTTAPGTTTPGTTTSGTTTTPAAPATGTSAAPVTGSASAGATGSLDGSTYVVRLRDLETRIDELKEQIRRSHTRLSLLSDTILSGGVGGARAEITFKNDLSSAFRLTGAVFVLDGVVQYNKQDDSDAGLLASQKEIPIFSGSIPPGDHTLQVVVRLRGYGYGVFSYLRGYKFEVKSSHSFTVTEGKTISLETIAWEKGDVTTPLEQRPTVRYLENVKTGLTQGAAPPSASKPSSGSTPGASGSTSTTATPAGGSASGNFSVGTGAK